MQFDPLVCYRALLAHDRRFDGVFFTCVTSTGIYCRPICPAIVPKRENCRFVASVFEAEKAGFRPCLRCRPELAPQETRRLLESPARRLAAYIDETLLMDETLQSAMQQYGVGERQMRRMFIQIFGLEPKQYVISRRLLFAKQLLQDTNLPVVEVAFSSGFNSRGRLTINMQALYGFTPQQIRRKKNAAESASAFLELRADYRPPFDWESLLHFLAARASPNEWIQDGAYHRMIDGHVLRVRNIPLERHVVIEIPLELSRRSYDILRRVRRMFDLDANPMVIADELSRDPIIAPLAARFPGLRMPGCWDDFEMLLRVIVGQQVSVAGATTIMRRLVDRVGASPRAIAESSPETIAAIGMPLRRATTLWNIGHAVLEGTLRLDEKNPELFYDQLVMISGIGPWTAEYLRMRVLRWPDAFPAGDLGLQKAVLPGQRIAEKQLMIYAEKWKPWRSYAAILLWKSLENKGG